MPRPAATAAPGKTDLLTLHSEPIIDLAAKLLAAFVLALPSAWDREVSTRRVGLRTFPLVSLASCGYVLLGTHVLYDSGAQARVLQGLITGMGFIGGGAILKEKGTVKGTATAASLWATGAVGAAVGYGQFTIALIVSLASFLTLRLLTPVKDEIRDGESGDGD